MTIHKYMHAYLHIHTHAYLHKSIGPRKAKILACPCMDFTVYVVFFSNIEKLTALCQRITLSLTACIVHSSQILKEKNANLYKIFNFYSFPNLSIQKKSNYLRLSVLSNAIIKSLILDDVQLFSSTSSATKRGI
jgi:hypothetical protein